MAKATKGAFNRLLAGAVLLLAAVVVFFLGNILGSRLDSGQQPQDQAEQQQADQERLEEGMVTIGDERIRIFGADGQPLSPEELRATNKRLLELSVEADRAEIGAGCLITPRVIRVSLEKGLESFTLINKDTQDHEIIIGGEGFKVKVAAGESVVVNPSDFIKFEGNLGYGCAGTNPSFFIVTP